MATKSLARRVPDSVGDAARRLLAARTASRIRALHHPVGAIVMYHRLAPRMGDPALEVSPALSASAFRVQLRYLKRTYDVVPVTSLLQRVQQRRAGERIPVSLTFDDDVSSHHAIAGPLLEEIKLPAAFFLTGACFDPRSWYWWHDVEQIRARGPDEWRAVQRELSETAGWPRSPFREVIRTMVMLPAEQREAVAERLAALAGSRARDPGLPAPKIQDLARRGFDVGFHTRRHHGLQTLNDAQLSRAMREGLDDIAAVIGRRPDAIAYPHGQGDLRVAAAAESAGFSLGFTYVGGGITANDCPLLLDRVDAWAPSLGSFALRLARVIATSARTAG